MENDNLTDLFEVLKSQGVFQNQEQMMSVIESDGLESLYGVMPKGMFNDVQEFSTTFNPVKKKDETMVDSGQPATDTPVLESKSVSPSIDATRFQPPSDGSTLESQPLSVREQYNLNNPNGEQPLMYQNTPIETGVPVTETPPIDWDSRFFNEPTKKEQSKDYSQWDNTQKMASESNKLSKDRLDESISTAENLANEIGGKAEKIRYEENKKREKEVTESYVSDISKKNNISKEVIKEKLPDWALESMSLDPEGNRLSVPEGVDRDEVIAFRDKIAMEQIANGGEEVSNQLKGYYLKKNNDNEELANKEYRAKMDKVASNFVSYEDKVYKYILDKSLGQKPDSSLTEEELYAFEKRKKVFEMLVADGTYKPQKQFYDPNTGMFLNNTKDEKIIAFNDKIDEFAKLYEGTDVETMKKDRDEAYLQYQYYATQILPNIPTEIQSRLDERIPNRNRTGEQNTYEGRKKAAIERYDTGFTGFKNMLTEDVGQGFDETDAFKIVNSGLWDSQTTQKVNDILSKYIALNKSIYRNQDPSNVAEAGFVDMALKGLKQSLGGTSTSDAELADKTITWLGDNGFETTEEQKDKLEKTIWQQTGEAAGGSIIPMIEIGVELAVLNKGAALLKIPELAATLANGNKAKQVALTWAYDLGVQGVAFEGAGQSFATGVGEGIGQNTGELLLSKLGSTNKLLNFLVKLSTGTIAEGGAEYSGELLGELVDNDFQLQKALETTFGKTPEEMAEKAAVTFMMSAMFSVGATSSETGNVAFENAFMTKAMEDVRNSNSDSPIVKAGKEALEIYDAKQRIIKNTKELEKTTGEKLVANLTDESVQAEIESFKKENPTATLSEPRPTSKAMSKTLKISNGQTSDINVSGEKVGEITTETIGDKVHIRYIDVKGSNQKKGYAKKAYQDAAIEAEKQGKVLASDKLQTNDQAEGVWESLVRDGDAKKNEDGTYEMVKKKPVKSEKNIDAKAEDVLDDLAKKNEVKKNEDGTYEMVKEQPNDILEYLINDGKVKKNDDGTYEVVSEQPVISADNSSNYANMTEDADGNFVFFHTGNKGYETIEPSTGGSATPKEEAAALSKIGGAAMYYTDNKDSERESGSGAKYAVKVPKDKVYDFNSDELGLIEEARTRHEEEHPGKAFDPNTQMAYVTKIAGEKGFDMVVGEWNGRTRAQTTSALTPSDTRISEGAEIKQDFKEKFESNAYKGFEQVVPDGKRMSDSKESEGVSKLVSLFKSDKKKIYKQVDNAIKAIAKVSPNTKVVTHNTSEEYVKSGEDRAQGDAGSYDVVNDEIHINLENANERTVAHEVFHAILLNKGMSNKQAQSITDRMLEAVKKTASPELIAKIELFSSQYENSLQSEESIAELFGILASEYETLPKPTQNLIKRWLDALAKMFGLKTFTDADIINMLNTVSSKVQEGEEITVEDVKILDNGTNPIGSPTEIVAPKERKQKIKFKESYENSLVTPEKQIDIDKLINDISDKKQKVWFWVADQVGINETLDGGASFAHQTPNEIWASSMPVKSIQNNIDKTDYIFIISGSPQLSKLFNKKVYDVITNKLGEFKTFKNESLKRKPKKVIRETLDKYDSWDELRDSTDRKPFLIALDSSKNTPNTEFTKYVNSIDGYVDLDSLRDGFYRENDFKQNDIMLVLKPTGVKEGSSHSTYSNTVLGEVIGVPDVKINAIDIMPKEMADKYSGSPRPQASQVIAPYGSGRRNITPRKQTPSRPSIEDVRAEAIKLGLSEAELKSALLQLGYTEAEINSTKEQTMADAIDKFKISRKRGNKKSASVKSAIADMQSTNWYRLASDTSREEAVRELKKELGVKIKKAPSVNKLLGKKADKVTVNEMTALKSQIRLEAKAAKGAVKAYKDASKSLITYIKQMSKGGVITSSQAMAIIKKVMSTNMLNKKLVDNLIKYADGIFNNAELSQKISKARKLNKNAKRNLKSKVGASRDLQGILSNLFSIDPSLIPLDMFDMYFDLVSDFSQRKSVLTLKESSQVIKDASDIINNIEEGIAKEEREKLPKEINEEIEADLDAYFGDILSTKIDKSNLDFSEAIELANFLNSLTKEDLESMVRKDKNGFNDYSMLENLKLVKDNLTNGYTPSMASSLRVSVEGSRSATEMTDVIKNKSKNINIALLFNRTYGVLKSAFTGKRSMTESVRSTMTTAIDDVLGNFNSKTIYNNTFGRLAKAYAAFEADLATNVTAKLDAADFLLNKSRIPTVKRLVNEVQKSKYKIQAYRLQREYESNPESNQVSPAIEFIDATINAIKDNKEGNNLNERDIAILESIKNDFESGGDISMKKIEESFSDNEKKALKLIDEASDMEAKALWTSTVIRGDGMKPINNYVHHNVSTDSEVASVLKKSGRISNPSTKSGTFRERTKGAKPINFDPISSTAVGARETLIDYHMTEAVKTVNSAIKKVRDSIDDVKAQREAVNAIENVVKETLESVLNSQFTELTFLDKTIQEIKKLGYQAALASIPRAGAELGSNMMYAFTKPTEFLSGVKNFSGFSMGSEGMNAMKNLGSSETMRLYDTNAMTSKMVDAGMSYTGAPKSQKSLNAVSEKARYIAQFTGAGQVRILATSVADKLISTPDKAISRPMWFGTFSNEFKKETGKSLTSEDMYKIADGTSEYLNENYKEAIDKATIVADRELIKMASSNNPFNIIPKNVQKPNSSAAMKIYKGANTYMASFMLNEYVTARNAVLSVRSKGDMSKAQALAALTGVTMRMFMYMILYSITTSAFDSLFGFENEDDEDDLQDLMKRQLLGAPLSMITGRGLGNVAKIPINYGVEMFNEEFLSSLRSGEDYAGHKHIVVFSQLSSDDLVKKSPEEMAIKTFAGAFSPMISSGVRAFKVVKGATMSAKDETKAKYKKELEDVIILESLGNLGFVPFYKDIRRMVRKNHFKNFEKEKKKKEKKKKKFTGF